MAKPFPVKPNANQGVIPSTIVVPAQAGWASTTMHSAQLPPRTAFGLLYFSEANKLNFDDVVDKFMESEFSYIWFEDVLEKLLLGEIINLASGVWSVEVVVELHGMLSPDEIDTLGQFGALLAHLSK